MTTTPITPAALTPQREAEIRVKLERQARAHGSVHFVPPTFGMVRDLLAEIDRLRAERHSTNEALAELTEARCTEVDVLRVEIASAQTQWEHWAREAERLQKRVAELEAERLRAGRRDEQRHQFLDLDADSCCRPAGFVCPAAHTAPELEATA